MSDRRHSQGYTLFVIIIVITLILLIITIGLLRVISSSINTTQQHSTSQNVFYGIESALHDSIGRIIASNYAWPPASANDTFTAPNNLPVPRTITKDLTTGDINITANTSSRNINREFHAEISALDINEGDQLDLIIVLDVSESMNNESEAIEALDPSSDHDQCDNGVPHPRCLPLDNARTAAIALVDTIFNEPVFLAQPGSVRIGIVSFNDYSENVVNLNEFNASNNEFGDSSALANDIDNIKIIPGKPYTNIGDGLRAAHQQFIDYPRDNSRKVIILLSDGSANMRGTPPSGIRVACTTQPTTITDCIDNPTLTDAAIQRADATKAENITIYTIGLNLIRLNPNIHAELARNTLIQIASTPENYFDSPDSNQLTTIFNNIGNKIFKYPQFNIKENY